LSATILTGLSSNGLPYVRYGIGKKTLVVFDGLDFSHKIPGFFARNMSTGYAKTLVNAGYTVYIVRRKKDLPRGYTMKDMADDYAAMIKNDIKDPVDIMGISTGSPPAECFAVYHPDLIRRLVLADAGCRLKPSGKSLQLELAELARQEKWRAAAAKLAEALAHGTGLFFIKPLLWLMGKSIFDNPSKPDDGIVEIEAEDIFDFRPQLKDIKCPTLVIGGDMDFFYDLKELADGIPGSTLILYNGIGHGAMKKKEFGRDVLRFLSAI
jgi:pimeloyl-ACP methyl ester carboxylesterase